MHIGFSENTPDSVNASRRIFENMHNSLQNPAEDPQQQVYPPPKTDTYNTYLTHAMTQRDASLAHSLLSTMNNNDSIHPNIRSFHILISQSAHAKLPLQTRRYIQQFLLAFRGVSLSIETVEILVKSYTLIGDLEAALSVFIDAVLLFDSKRSKHLQHHQRQTNTTSRPATASSSSPSFSTTTTTSTTAVTAATATSNPTSTPKTTLDLPSHDDLELADFIARKRNCQVCLLEAFALRGDLEGVLRVYQTVLMSFSAERSPDASSSMIQKANRYLLEALIRGGFVKEAGAVLVGGGRQQGPDLMGIVFGIIEKKRRVARLNELRQESATAARQKTPLSAASPTSLWKLFDGNNTITTTRPSSPFSLTGPYVTTTTSLSNGSPLFGAPLPSTMIPSSSSSTAPTQADSMTTIYPPILHTILLHQIILQSSSSSSSSVPTSTLSRFSISQSTPITTATTNRLLAHIQTCLENSIPINLSAFNVVLKYLTKYTSSLSIASGPPSSSSSSTHLSSPITATTMFSRSNHSLYEPLSTLFRLYKSAGFRPPEKLYKHLLVTLTHRVNTLRKNSSMKTQNASQNDGDSSSSSNSNSNKANRMNEVSNTISSLQKSSLEYWIDYQEQYVVGGGGGASSAADNGGSNVQKTSAALLPWLLQIHIDNTPGITVVLKYIDAQQQQQQQEQEGTFASKTSQHSPTLTKPFIYTLLIRYAACTIRNLDAARGFLDAYLAGLQEQQLQELNHTDGGGGGGGGGKNNGSSSSSSAFTNTTTAIKIRKKPSCRVFREYISACVKGGRFGEVKRVVVNVLGGVLETDGGVADGDQLRLVAAIDFLMGKSVGGAGGAGGGRMDGWRNRYEKIVKRIVFGAVGSRERGIREASDNAPVLRVWNRMNVRGGRLWSGAGVVRRTRLARDSGGGGGGEGNSEYSGQRVIPDADEQWRRLISSI
ncbi:hypothetical protein BDR26DRAFT_858513 [Obelidium mucronatum]|nr:hypothetical protein BDR26DRAFT_858513 [Obelidium mucronatum]